MQAGAGPGETNNRPEPSRDGADALLHAAFDELATESGSQAGVDLDLHTTRELVELMNDGDATVPAVVRAAAAEIAAAVDAIVERLQRGGRLVYVGAGSSGRIATLDASECESTFSTRPGDVVAVIAGGHDASPLEQEAAEDDEDAGSAALRELDVSAADAVVALTASGRTPFVLGAARAARAAGALTVGIVSVPRSDLARVADHAIGVVVGPEFLAGSTRLKAGTAQKLVLNMISTISMIRLGKTFGNLMVDVCATNEKLRARVRRIVATATGATESEIDDALGAADGNAKVAIVSLLAGVDVDTARAALAGRGESIRRAVSE